MESPFFIATERFDSSNGASWKSYTQGINLPGLIEVITLDASLCPRITNEILDEDWAHVVQEDFRIHFFRDLDYLQTRVKDIRHKNILAVFQNPKTRIRNFPESSKFNFIGYDLIEDATQISALTNCGGFPDVFQNSELNCFGLISDFDRADEVRRLLPERYPEEAHANCEMYAIWRLDKSIGLNPTASP